MFFLGIFVSPSANSLVQYFNDASSINKDTVLFSHFQELHSLKISLNFTKPGEKPNIVLIYGESLEQRYFDENTFPGLLPNLKKLRDQSVSFVNVYQGIDAGWTVGGMVASQCGYPLSIDYNISGNSMSMFDSFMPKAICLGDLLRNEGYHLTFVGGADERFAGKDKFLRSHGYNELIGRDELVDSLADKSYVNEWGVFDDTLFEYAFNKFLALSHGQSPFFLTLLTLDTHHPKGFLSATCGKYGSGANSMLNAVHCSDQLITGFIEQIRNSPYSDNTIIVLVSDHLAMRNAASDLLAASQRPKRLTFFINTPEAQSDAFSNAGTHYDIAPTILDYMGYKISGQLGFGASLLQGPGYLPGMFGENTWPEKKRTLQAVAKTLWDNKTILDKDGINVDVRNLTLTMGGRQFNLSSDGISPVPCSTLFVFDNKSLQLEKVYAFAFDRKPDGLELSKEGLSKLLLQNKEDLALAISRASNLPGFCSEKIHQSRGCFFFGKPGSSSFISAPITGSFSITWAIIKTLRSSKIDSMLIRSRENIVTAREFDKNPH